MKDSIISQVLAHFGSQEKMANAISITQPSVQHILNTQRVSAEIALRIQKKTNNQFLAVDLRPSLKEHFTEISVA